MIHNIPHYDGLVHHIVETSPGLYFNTIEFKKEFTNFIVTPDDRWISTIVLEGTFEICDCEDPSFIQTCTCEVGNNYIQFSESVMNKNITYNCAKDSVVTFVLAIEENDSYNMETQYHYWNGEETLPQDYGMFILSGTVSTDSAMLEKWDYQLPRNINRLVEANDAHVMLIKRLVEKDWDNRKIPIHYHGLYQRLKDIDK